jgi:hypothetical protein
VKWIKFLQALSFRGLPDGISRRTRQLVSSFGDTGALTLSARVSTSKVASVGNLGKPQPCRSSLDAWSTVFWLPTSVQPTPWDFDMFCYADVVNSGAILIVEVAQMAEKAKKTEVW